MVYSASADIGSQNGESVAICEATAFVILGLAIYTFMVLMNLNKLRDKKILKYASVIAIGSLLFLLIIGKTINGAAGWIRLGPISIQPAEFVKFYLIIWLAHVIDRRQDAIAIEGWWAVMLRPSSSVRS